MERERERERERESDRCIYIYIYTLITISCYMDRWVLRGSATSPEIIYNNMMCEL